MGGHNGRKIKIARHKRVGGQQKQSIIICKKRLLYPFSFELQGVRASQQFVDRNATHVRDGIQKKRVGQMGPL